MKNLEENYISIVTEAQNCCEIVTDKLTELNTALMDIFKYYEIIVVDNYSHDGTADRLNGLSFPVTVVTLPHLHNNQSALTAGVELAVGDYILEIPRLSASCDFSLIGEMYRTCQQGNDFVFIAPSKSSFSSKMFYNVLNRYFKGQLAEKFVSSIMTLSSRRGQNKTADSSSKIVNRNVSYIMTGLKCAVVQSETAIKNGRSLKENISLMLDTLMYHTDYMYHFVIKIALIFLGISFLTLVYALVVFFAINTAPGWASTFILMAVGFGALFGILAAVFKYLSNIIKASKPKTYTFSSIDKRGAK